MKTIGIVTGTRAEYGLLSRTIDLLQKDSNFECWVFACGAHLAPEHGYTITELRENGVTNIVPVEMLLSSNSRVGIAKSVGLATISFADALAAKSLDALMVLGDRYEILAAVQAAMFLDISIIHIHGGEVTQGAFDDAIRHSVSKMANIHFPASEQFAKRLKQLGESQESIFVVGSPGVDNIVNGPRLPKPQLEDSLGFELNGPIALVTYHPVTKAANVKENDIRPLVAAIKALPDITFVITFPNADGGGDKIIEQWQSIGLLEHVKLVPSLGFKRYLSLMEQVECVIGNSSSGIIEAPSFQVGTVNIGTRQDGRPQGAGVINVDMNEKQILQAIETCRTSAFKSKIKDTINPYGNGNTATTIVELLTTLEFSDFSIKKFKDHQFDE